MYSQCPECRTVFKLAASELAAAHASVRCSFCNLVFDALPSLAEQLPPEPIGDLALHPRQSTPPQLGQPVFRPHSDSGQGTLFFDPTDRPARSSEPASASPAFVRRTRQRRTSARAWPWIAASLVLALTLAGQVGWADRARWVDDAHVRPLLESACAHLGCVLPLSHDADTLQLVSRDIRPHPSVPGALIISATLHNRSTAPQAWPAVQITLSDLDENRIAMRRFNPREYVNDSRALKTGLAAAANASLVFEVVDPGKNAVAFEFRFERASAP